MSNTIDGMPRNDILPLNHHAMRLLCDFINYYKAMLRVEYPNVQRIDENLWGPNILSRTGDASYADVSRFPYYKILDVNGDFLAAPFTPVFMEVSAVIGVFYYSGTRISFEYKIDSNAIYNTENEIALQMFNVSTVKLNARGMYDITIEVKTEVIQRIITTETHDEDWIVVDEEVSSADCDVIIFSVNYQSLKKSLIAPHDWGSSGVQIRRFFTSPPQIKTIVPLIGAVNTQPPAGAITLSKNDTVNFIGRFHIVTATMIELSGIAPANGVPRHLIATAGEISLTRKNPAYVWEIPRYEFLGAKLIYTLTLTGQASPYLPDIEIPISSFQSIIKNGGATVDELTVIETVYDEQVETLDQRLADGEISESDYETTLADLTEEYQNNVTNAYSARPCYLSCVIPNAVKYADEITARSNGELIIKKGYLMPDGTRNLEEIVRANYDYIMTDTGAKSSSATITGYKVRSFISPKERRVSGVSYQGTDSSGRLRIRATMDLFLRPQDTCIYGDGEDERFVVGQISYSVNERSAVMEVTEQDENFEE